MKQGRYLNIILTINAVLLTVLVWTQITVQPAFVSGAHAQQAGGGMVSAGEQRQRMIESLREIQKSVHETNRALDRKTIRVYVENASDMRSSDNN
jgi:hypothetical protein